MLLCIHVKARQVTMSHVVTLFTDPFAISQVVHRKTRTHPECIKFAQIHIYIYINMHVRLN